jgi:hypothetical protein
MDEGSIVYGKHQVSDILMLLAHWYVGAAGHPSEDGRQRGVHRLSHGLRGKARQAAARQVCLQQTICLQHIMSFCPEKPYPHFTLIGNPYR